MILDYTYNTYRRSLDVSYVNDKGGKSIMKFNVDRFKSFYITPNGKFENWDGRKCDVKYVTKPSSYDIKTYLREKLSEADRKKLQGKVYPKLYTFDIETEVHKDKNGVSIFPEPATAAFPITTISIASSDLNVIVLGTKEMKESNADEILNKLFINYLNQCRFFCDLNIPTPRMKYIKFNSESEMISYFLSHIVAKVAAIAGWNSILFDMRYIQNRIANYYPELSVKLMSATRDVHPKNYTDMRGEKVRLMMPNHTLVLDMMDVIGTFDMVVMPIKESLSLDYIASESVGAHKIEYDGDLGDLYENDFLKYVFYNAIDSVLVQLIDKRFKTLQNLCIQALYCQERIEAAFSKIAISEALVFNDFYEHGIKVVPEFEHLTDRGTLPGAYVKQPVTGRHKFICCNDFASLYPTGIITCNISYDNFVAAGRDLTPTQIEKYKADPNYFVSVNNNVYKNDKDYSFKRIQMALKANRNTGKYLGKELDAVVMTDIDHILKDRKKFIAMPVNHYAENLIKAMENIGYYVCDGQDLIDHDDEWIREFKHKLQFEIEYYSVFEQSMKLMGNSMYGGSSHIAFDWFNLDLASDITGEGRNLIHYMEKYIPQFWRDNWLNMKDLHKKLGIEVDPEAARRVLEEQKATYNNDSYVLLCYGDTDSLYISYYPMLQTIKGVDKMSIEQKADIIIRLNTEFMDQHNKEVIEKYYAGRHAKSTHKFELETLSLTGVWLDVKKRYAQILLWKDGKRFDLDNLPLKVKGLEIIKSSYPKQARESLKVLVRALLEDNKEDRFLLQRMNILMMQEKDKYFKADIEDICMAQKVNGYDKYILDDKDPYELKVASKCPSNVKALGNYNRIRQLYNLPGDPIYGGKVKIYQFKTGKLKRRNKTGDNLDSFAFVSKNYPKWADEYAPISRVDMFQKTVLDPYNRILNAIGLGNLYPDGHLELTLF